jgi:hypothetical protein
MLMLLNGQQNGTGNAGFRLRVAATVIAFMVMSTWVTSAAAPVAEPSGERRGTTMTRVRYSDFGAKGDGETDDLDAIAKAHEYANKQGLAVSADDDAVYYIGGGDKTVVIETDTDFGSARFIIDDMAVKNRQANIFTVRSALKPIGVKGVRSLTRKQKKIDV